LGYTILAAKFGDNSIGEKGGVALAQALKINSTLQYLSIYGNLEDECNIKETFSEKIRH
jgi:hypothetical protein